MKRGTPQHPKTAMLAAELSLPLYAAVGILESLWHWTALYAKRGDVGRYPNVVIAQAIGWDMEPDKLVTALVTCRWLDEHTEHRLVIHDWHEHAEDAVHMALARAVQRFANGAVPSLSRLPKEERAQIAAAYEQSPAHGKHTGSTRETQALGGNGTAGPPPFQEAAPGAREPGPAQRDATLAGPSQRQAGDSVTACAHEKHTACAQETHCLSLGLSQGLNTPPTPSRGLPPQHEHTPNGSNGAHVANGSPAKSSKTPELTPGFDQFWAEWPPHKRKAAKDKCQRLWRSRGLEPQAGRIVEAVRAAKASRDWRKDNGEYVPAPHTWLNEARWEAVRAGDASDRPASSVTKLIINGEV